MIVGEKGEGPNCTGRAKTGISEFQKTHRRVKKTGGEGARTAPALQKSISITAVEKRAGENAGRRKFPA